MHCVLGLTAFAIGMAEGHFQRVGPITIEVAPGRPAQGDKPGVSATYRNIAAKDGLPESFEGATTLYESFNAAVERFGDCK